MATVKRIKHFDIAKRTQKGVEEAVLGVAEQGVTIAALKLTSDSGGLKQSLAATSTSKTSAIFGSPLEYAPYVEFGTGKHAEKGGRSTPWVYFNEKLQKFFWTEGQHAQPYLRPAADKLKTTGSRIFAKILKGVLDRG